MAEEIGFRTPAKEIEILRKRIEHLESVGIYVSNAVTLSIWALAQIHGMKASEDPKNARKLKDDLLSALKQAKISHELIDLLDSMLKITCEYFEETMG